MNAKTLQQNPDPSWLDAFPGLAGVRDAGIEDVIQSARVHSHRAGTRLLKPGDPCESFVLLARGTVRVFQSYESGREIVLFRVRAGELCALTLSDLSAARPYSAHAIAEEDVEIIIIPATKFREALARSEAFRSFVLSSLSHRLCEVMGLVEQVAFQRLDLRLACLLGQLFGQRNTSRLYITHQELANDLGTSREVASRVLKEFEKMGCIRLGRSEIELLSPETLNRLGRSNEV
jgi:CRP/FNR family transcriptional regulator